MPLPLLGNLYLIPEGRMWEAYGPLYAVYGHIALFFFGTDAVLVTKGAQHGSRCRG